MANSQLSIEECYAVFKHQILPVDKECRTWYRLVGDLSSGRPLVLLHGGPGSGHSSAKRCFDAFPAMAGKEVVYYGQLGCGNSTRLPEKKGDEKFWTSALFVAELDNLLRHLGIGSDFDLYGHSWGAKLAAKYAVSQEEKGSGLHKIILSSGAASQKDLIQSVKNDIAAMPQATQDLIKRCIADGHEDEHEYQLALWDFFKSRVSSTIPRPKPRDSLMAQFMTNNVVYSTMLGLDIFHVEQGNLRSKSAYYLHASDEQNELLKQTTAFDMTHECQKIKQHALLLNGEYEESSFVQPFFDGIPRVKWFVFSGSRHTAASDQPENYRNVVRNFLKAEISQ